jgi:hypothetical protein
VKIGERKHFGKLLAQADLHGRLYRVNSILGKSARLDIAIEKENLMSRQSYLLRGEQTCGTGPYYEYALQFSSPLAHEIVQPSPISGRR